MWKEYKVSLLKNFEDWRKSEGNVFESMRDSAK